MSASFSSERIQRTLIKQKIKFVLAQSLGTLINKVVPFDEPLILNYHGISLNNQNASDINDVKYEDFMAQIRMLQILGFKFLSLSEFIELYNKGELTSSHCLITFDDVPLSFLSAAKFLAFNNIPFAVFICVAYANSKNKYWCTWEDLKKVEAFSKAEFGSHSIYHRRLPKVKLADTLKEIEQSFDDISIRLSGLVRAFAFPYGAFNLNLLEELNKSKIYPLLLTDTLMRTETIRKYNAFRRISVGLYDSKKIFISKINGRYRFL